MEEIRLQKLFTDCGILSRRAAEKEIKAGRVTVNGSVAQLGQKICPDTDIVVYKGKRISLPESKNFVYILLNKPCGIVTSAKDEKGRTCVTDIVKAGTRVYPVGRLDLNSQGLLLMTNDGELTNRLTHPKHHMSKTYSVIIKGEISPEALHKLTSPMEIDGYSLKPVKVRILTFKNGATNTLFTLNEGRNRQIRKMCEKCGLTIMRLTRISIGKLKLGDLERGKWRDLTQNEVDYLCGKSDTI